MSAKQLTVYQRIMRAAKRGAGLRLSVDDVFALSCDDAVSTCAANDDDGLEYGRERPEIAIGHQP